MARNAIYQPRYGDSWALVVGINDYATAPPLAYARQDAEAFSGVLQTAFGFPSEKMTVLFDSDATRDGIMKAFLSYAENSLGVDDRVVVFFAGHGCTRTGSRGEVGYLVPVDGDVGDLSTLVRWDELTRNAELVPAKHMLFVMDACYGGLAVMRTPPAGSSRFMHDMLQRFSRQVLTAGKADEPVADSGGPRPGHSVFTGHLLNAIEGDAATADGLITANAVMAYVYDRVSRDPHSHQTPHFGFIDGDGDFIFNVPQPAAEADAGEGGDMLIQLPATGGQTEEMSPEVSLAEVVKDYLSDPKFRIRLDDLVSAELRTSFYELGEDRFPSRVPSASAEEFGKRLRDYEAALERLATLVGLMCRWGTSEHQPMIERVLARLSDTARPRAGSVVWLDLRWYPLMRLIYVGGIAALSAGNYMSLWTLLTTPVVDNEHEPPKPVILPTVGRMADISVGNMFKQLPGHERHYVPRSEYLFGSVQPQVEDLLFLGTSYEGLFDRFEILFALVHADLVEEQGHRLWGPPGRFAWKHTHGAGPFRELVAEAATQGSEWAPLRAGFFRGSQERFDQVANGYRELLDRSGWF